jgi:hypothetical protein
MANSGPGWQGIEIAWDLLNEDREYERVAHRYAPRPADIDVLPDDAPAVPYDTP